jgi:hypothetical protein
MVEDVTDKHYGWKENIDNAFSANMIKPREYLNQIKQVH